MTAKLAQSAGWTIDAFALRDSSTSPLPAILGIERVPLSVVPPSDVIFLAVTDDSLEGVAAQILTSAPAESHLVHLSGSRASELLAPHARRASLHPLASLPLPPETPDLRDVLFVAEGADDTLDLLERELRTSGARLSRIAAGRKPLYHAAAVMGSNYVALLAEVSRRVMEAAGVDDIQRRDIAALSRSAIANWESGGIGATTGPIARGDVGTIEQNLESLAAHRSELELYEELGARLARALGAADQSAIYQEIAEMLERRRSR